MNQRDGRPSAAASPPTDPPGSAPDWLTARAAAQALGVSLPTLYAYVSRGQVRSVPVRGGRARRYHADDVERLSARQRARKGHAPAAAGALRFGEPVLETAVATVTPEGPVYRGHLLRELLAAGASFEAVAELLFTGTLPSERPRWPAPPRAAAALLRRAAALAATARPIPRLGLVAAAVAASAPAAPSAAAALDAARTLIVGLAGVAGTAPPAGDTVAERVLSSLAGQAAPRALAAVDRALVLCADHELNASTFAARVAASAGAELPAAVVAALGTLSGALHGGACDRVEGLVESVRAPAQARAALEARLRRGETIPGLGHPLYRAGDPRGAELVRMARALSPAGAPARRTLAVVDAAAELRLERPTLDLGLVALAHALSLPAGSAGALFAIGRTAGWVAHALEQRAQGFLLRPRARYVGPAPR